MPQPTPPPEVKPTYSQPVDEQQLKRELGAAAEKESDNPLVEIARQMREAQQRIARADSGPGTQQLQRQIVDDLGPPDPASPQERRPMFARARRQSQPGSQHVRPVRRVRIPAPPAANSPTAIRPRPVRRVRPTTSGSQAGRRRNASHDEAPLGRFAGTPREQMLQSPIEEFPPKYELQIEDYFRRLSEEKRGE